ncbi:NfeD family protein [Rhizorhapis sp. SPR117]|uniref:NfeD family protein n=1 Tax=Rhizorhapis sp. SPR117 TaxID=2912611 RepID=UPI00403EC972
MEMMSQIELDAHWWWLIFAVVLGIGEIIIPGVFLIWIAVAAAFTGVVTMLVGGPLAVQLVIFALASAGITWFGRRWYLKNPVVSSDPLLNDRAARIIGRTVTVVEAIVHGEGRVKVGDGVWPASGPDLPEGASAQVTGVRDGVLVVDPISKAE